MFECESVIYFHDIILILQHINGQVAQLEEHQLSKQKVASTNPSSVWSWGKRRCGFAKGPMGSTQPPTLPSQMLEKLCLRVKSGAV